MILINATDMTSGARFTFHQVMFGAICSDLSKFPVSRACAASSAVPGVLTPLTIKNYAGSCGFLTPELYKTQRKNYRQLEMEDNISILLDPEKKRYLHLIDGGVADNLGLRAIEESVDVLGNIWTVMQRTGREKVRKIVFITVNAETKIESMWDKIEFIPPLASMISNYTAIGILRYNRETMAVLQESFDRWTHQIRLGRCPPGQISKEPGSCGDIEFYLVDVRFDHIGNKEESDYLSRLPTSFRLSDDEVDRLRAAARKILNGSADFRKLLRDLNTTVPEKVSP